MGERGSGGDGGRETGGRQQHTDFPSSCQSGATPLFSAAGKGHGPVVEQLIAARCNVDLATTGDTQTPLYNAAMEGHAQVVEQLIAARCNVDLANTDDGQTPLYTASNHGHAAVVEQLIAARCNLNLVSTVKHLLSPSLSLSLTHTHTHTRLCIPRRVSRE